MQIVPLLLLGEEAVVEAAAAAAASCSLLGVPDENHVGSDRDRSPDYRHSMSFLQSSM